jgi:uncharacterized protein YqgV (UPF0045/DUF77 family)
LTAFARLEVTPVGEHRAAGEIAKAVPALDEFDVSSETTAMDTVIEAESAEWMTSGPVRRR